MSDVFIGLEEAAAFEGITYKGLTSRISRNPQQFKTKTQPREGGGKDQVMISVASLSAKGRKAWKAAQKVDGRDVIIDKRTDAAPWYVGADLNHFIEGDGGKRKKAYYEAVELAARIQDFVGYDGPDRTAYAERYALGLGVSLPTLYRYVDNVLKANAWALKLEREDGQNRDYFRALALCRKPREKATFPSLTDEQRAVIENIWFDRRFAANLGTLEMLYERFEEIAQGRGWEDYPSIKTVARYVKHLMDSRGAASARYLAANGSREWKNKMMLKGRRDATSLKVMEYVVGDEHTFDLWVQWTAPNGKVKAVRPKLVAWMDMKSRAIIGDVACIDANSQTLKERASSTAPSTTSTTPGRTASPRRRPRCGRASATRSRSSRSGFSLSERMTPTARAQRPPTTGRSGSPRQTATYGSPVSMAGSSTVSRSLRKPPRSPRTGPRRSRGSNYPIAAQKAREGRQKPLLPGP